MYCEECGTKNVEGAKFCEACGAKMAIPAPKITVTEQKRAEQKTTEPEKSELPKTEPTKAESVRTEPVRTEPVNAVANTKQVPAKPPMKAWQKAAILCAVGIIILIFAAFKMGQSYYSPEKVTKRYMSSVQKEDWKEAFSYLDIKKSKFINVNSFKEALSSELGYEKVKNFKVLQGIEKAGRTDKDSIGLTRNMKVYYISDNSSEQQDITVKLVKLKKKEFLVFNKWKVSPETLQVSDYSIAAPSGTELLVDGQKISAKNIESTEDGIDYYTIKSMLKGKHKVKITSPYIEDAEEEVYPEDGGYEDSLVNEITIKPDIVKGLIKQAEEDYTAIYKAAFEKKDFDSIKALFSSDKEVQSRIRQNYESLLGDMEHEDGTSITKLTLHDFSGEQEYVLYSSIFLQTFSMKVTCDYDYTSKNWWTGELEDQSDSNEDSYEVTYQLEGDKWVIASIYLNSIYYY